MTYNLLGLKILGKAAVNVGKWQTPSFAWRTIKMICDAQIICCNCGDRVTCTGTRLGCAFQRLSMCATTRHTYGYREGPAFVQMEFGVLLLFNHRNSNWQHTVLLPLLLSWLLYNNFSLQQSSVWISTKLKGSVRITSRVKCYIYENKKLAVEVLT